MLTQARAARHEPLSRADHRRRVDPMIDPNDVESRCREIRRGWSEAERFRRAYTARVVQSMLLVPTVGFRLEAE